MDSSNEDKNSKQEQHNLGKPWLTYSEEKHAALKPDRPIRQWLLIIVGCVLALVFIETLASIGKMQSRLESIENKMELISSGIGKDNGKILDHISKKDGANINKFVGAALEVSDGVKNKDPNITKQEIGEKLNNAPLNIEQRTAEQHSENKTPVSDVDTNTAAKHVEQMNDTFKEINDVLGEPNEGNAIKHETPRAQNIRAMMDEFFISAIDRENKEDLEYNKPRRNPDGTYNCGFFKHQSLSWCKAVQRMDEEHVRDSARLVNRHFSRAAEMKGLAKKAGILTEEEFDKKFNAVINEVQAGRKPISEKIAAGRDEIINERDKLEQRITAEQEKVRQMVQGGVMKSLDQQLSDIGNSLDVDMQKKTEKKDDKQALVDKTKK